MRSAHGRVDLSHTPYPTPYPTSPFAGGWASVRVGNQYGPYCGHAPDGCGEPPKLASEAERRMALRVEEEVYRGYVPTVVYCLRPIKRKQHAEGGVWSTGSCHTPRRRARTPPPGPPLPPLTSAS